MIRNTEHRIALQECVLGNMPSTALFRGTSTSHQHPAYLQRVGCLVGFIVFKVAHLRTTFAHALQSGKPQLLVTCGENQKTAEEDSQTGHGHSLHHWGWLAGEGGRGGAVI